MSQMIIDPTWLAVIGAEFEKPYMQQLRTFLRAEKDQKKIIYPKSDQVFQAFNLTPFDQVRVVLLGQDPYHGPGQAQGLCFSVPVGISLPGSLRNIYKELKTDLNVACGPSGCLENWGKQGILLLNSVLTVQKGLAASHQNKGWETFSDSVIACLNEQKKGLVFLLWGAYAQRKGQLINTQKHSVLKAAHPSPLSAHQGFLGSKHFSKTNDYLIAQGKKPIDWQIRE